MISKNSKSEINSLKYKIFNKLSSVFLWKKISKVYRKKNEENFSKFFQKKIYELMEIYIEDCSFMLFSKIITHYVFFPKVHIQCVNLILSQIIECYLKNFFIVKLEENLRIMFKITEGKINNQKVSLKLISFLDLIRNSKGKINNLTKKKNTRKTQLFSANSSYEGFQGYLENIRIKLDCKKMEISGVILNQIFAKSCILSNYSKIRLCFYQQIIKFFQFTQQINLIIILYFSIIIDFFRSRIQTADYPQEIFIIALYFIFFEKFEKNFRFYLYLIFILGKKFNTSMGCIIKNILISTPDWKFFKNIIFPRIDFLSIFSDNPNINILKHMRAMFIKNNIILFSRKYSSLNINHYSSILSIDFKDTEHWLHYLINSKKIIGKIDRSLGKVFFDFFF
jgi:hypothetical protein